MNKKGVLQVLALLNPWVLLGIGIFILLIFIGIVSFAETLIGVIMIGVAAFLFYKGIDYRVALVVMLVGALFVWQPAFIFDELAITENRGNLATGGNVFVEIDEPDYSVYDPELNPFVEYSVKVTIYPGRGWDNICYSGLVGYYVAEDKFLGGDVVTGGKFEYGTINHNADQKNSPKSYTNNIRVGITNFEPGKYKLIARNFMTTLNDRPSIGECKSTSIWKNILNRASNVARFEDNPLLWLESVGSDSYIINVGSDIARFEVEHGAPAQQPEMPEIPKEEETCGLNIVCWLEKWLNYDFAWI